MRRGLVKPNYSLQTNPCDDMFKDRKLIIATKHKKESVIAPILEESLGVVCQIDEGFDSDEFGTFTGEIERLHDPISTARRKCLKAMQSNGCDLGIASEGSFGPHPFILSIPSDEEFLIFIDSLHGLEFIVRELSATTNFSGKEVQYDTELDEFAEKAGFPTHGLILRKSKYSNEEIYKNIKNHESLHDTFQQIISKYDTAYIETDMRAMYNPTRMGIIKKTTHKLVEKIKSKCPKCEMPGFGIVYSKKGLPCRLCGSPTESTLSHIYICQHCEYTVEKVHPNSRTNEDPRYCNNCNP
jgi:hypothetical protein